MVKTNTEDRDIAYFSMEIGLRSDIPTYSGGLGVLAGDTIRAGADMKVPMVAVTLSHRRGYFKQKLDTAGWQTEEYPISQLENFFKEQGPRVSVQIEGRTVHLRSWRFDVVGVKGAVVPVYLLDSDLPENTAEDRTLTHFLYGGDHRYRVCQEVILGMGGVRMLRALGYKTLKRFHMNEGHSSFLTLELLNERVGHHHPKAITPEDLEAVKTLCAFTTHTPVPAGHDKFPMDLVTRVMGDHPVFHMKDVFCVDNVCNMTYLSLNLSDYVNGVAKKHGEVSRLMFTGHTIDAITNGVHAATWTSRPVQQLFDKYIPEWRQDNASLRYALNIPRREIWEAHMEAKDELLQYIKRETGSEFDVETLTLGFARRATAYKRADLLFHDVERLRRIAQDGGPLQIVYAGKAHPHDTSGKELIKKIFDAKNLLTDNIRIIYLANYDMDLGKLITSGVDVWLNTPEPPLEASGTSGMKSALNGVPSLSVLDGWWIEGCIEGVTGWAIDSLDEERAKVEAIDRVKDAESLYRKLEEEVVAMYYKDRSKFIDVMLHAIALNGSFFNTQRMMQEYIARAYYS